VDERHKSWGRKQLVNLMLIDFNSRFRRGSESPWTHLGAAESSATLVYSQPVRWGDQSWDEILVAFAGVIVDPKTDAKKLITMRQPAAPQN
jgi:hypothetical protein